MLRPCTYIQNENVQKSLASSYFPFSPRVPELKVLQFGWDKVYISIKTFVNLIVIELMKILSKNLEGDMSPCYHTFRRPFSRYCCVHFDNKFWDFSGHIYDSINQGLPKK